MSTQNKALRVINFLLGESDNVQPTQPKFTKEFEDTLALIDGITDCSNLSFDWGDEEDDDPGIDKLENLFFDYAEKYGAKQNAAGGSLIRRAMSHLNSGRRISDDFWSDVISDLTHEVVRAIKSGKLKPYVNDMGPEGQVTALQAVADARGLEVEDIDPDA